MPRPRASAPPASIRRLAARRLRWLAVPALALGLPIIGPDAVQAHSAPTAHGQRCDSELAALVRLSRNARSDSAAQFRLHEEIDRLAWP